MRIHRGFVKRDALASGAARAVRLKVGAARFGQGLVTRARAASANVVICEVHQFFRQTFVGRNLRDGRMQVELVRERPATASTGAANEHDVLSCHLVTSSNLLIHPRPIAKRLEMFAYRPFGRLSFSVSIRRLLLIV